MFRRATPTSSCPDTGASRRWPWAGCSPGSRRTAGAAVWSSPYLRARQTAELAVHTGGWQTPVLLDERLRDRELGILDMLTSAGVEARLPQEAERRRWLGKFYYRPPGGESWADVVLRLRSLLADLDRLHPGAAACCWSATTP